MAFIHPGLPKIRSDQVQVDNNMLRIRSPLSMRFRYPCFTTLAFCLLLALPGANASLCAAQTASQTHDLAPILVGINANLPPFEYLDAGGNPQGYDVDLLRAVAKTMDLKLQFRSGPFERVRKDLEAKLTTERRNAEEALRQAHNSKGWGSLPAESPTISTTCSPPSWPT